MILLRVFVRAIGSRRRSSYAQLVPSTPQRQHTIATRAHVARVFPVRFSYLTQSNKCWSPDRVERIEFAHVQWRPFVPRSILDLRGARVCRGSSRYLLQFSSCIDFERSHPGRTRHIEPCFFIANEPLPIAQDSIARRSRLAGQTSKRRRYHKRHMRRMSTRRAWTIAFREPVQFDCPFARQWRNELGQTQLDMTGASFH